MVLVLVAAVVLMHVLGTTAAGAGHHGPWAPMPAGVQTVVSAHDAGGHPGHGGQQAPEPLGHLASMNLCAFAVLAGAGLLLQAIGVERKRRVPTIEPSLRPAVGPDPPVPRPAA